MAHITSGYFERTWSLPSVSRRSWQQHADRGKGRGRGRGRGKRREKERREEKEREKRRREREREIHVTFERTYVINIGLVASS